MSKFHLRILLGITFSVVFHALLLFVISMQDASSRQRHGGHEIRAQLRLVPAAEKENPAERAAPITLAEQPAAPAKSSASQKYSKEKPEQVNTVSLAASTVAAASAPAISEGEPSGVGITRTITLPWLMGMQVRSPEASQPTVNYRAIMEARSREELNRDAQLIEQQIYQLLAKRMKGHKTDDAGNCILEDSGNLMRLICTPDWLQKSLHDDAKSLIDLFQSLRQKGKVATGFSLELHYGQAIIVLNDGAKTDGH